MDKFFWKENEFDREFFLREIDSFLPERIFDSHAHLERFDDAAAPPSSAVAAGYLPELSLAVYRRLMTALHGDRHTDALCIGGVPVSNDRCAVSNEYVASQVAGDPDCRAHFLARPTDDPEWVRDEVRRLRMCGIKPFHAFVRDPISATMQCDIPEYLPEPLMRVAHEESWAVTIHLVKDRAVADEANLHWIRYYSRTYPDAKLLLCHTARTWNPSHALEAFPKLKDLDNVWICTDLNCSPISTLAAFKILGPERIVYGSDFWCSHARGLCTYAGDGFLWLEERNYNWTSEMFGRGPTLVGLEHLRAVKWACWAAGLSDTQIENYFWHKPRELFGLE